MIEHWIKFKDDLRRYFAVGTQSQMETLALSLDNIWQMKTQFYTEYERLMEYGNRRCFRMMKLKKEAV